MVSNVAVLQYTEEQMPSISDINIKLVTVPRMMSQGAEATRMWIYWNEK